MNKNNLSYKLRLNFFQRELLNTLQEISYNIKIFAEKMDKN